MKCNKLMIKNHQPNLNGQVNCYMSYIDNVTNVNVDKSKW